MYRSRNKVRAYRIPIDELGMPIRVFIGKKGAVIKLLQELCQCGIRVNNREGCVDIFAQNRKLVDAKRIIGGMVRTWKETGQIDLPKPIKKSQRPKVTINTDSDGWTSRSSTSQKHRVEEKKEDSPVSTCYRGQFADLGESSDEETYESDSPTEEFPALISSKIQLTIKEKDQENEAQTNADIWLANIKKKPRSKKRWADIADDADEDSDDEDDEE